MTPAEAAAAIGRPIGSIGSRFMFDPTTYSDAAEFGYNGLDFYFAGRAGVLGDVAADVASAALGFFDVDTVRTLWDQGCAVAGASVAAERFGAACAKWGRDHFGGGVDYDELNRLAALVIAAAPAAGFPLFAGWRSVPLAADAKGAACQQLNTLRELRGGAHLVAVLAAGVTPFEAVLAKGGVANAQLFGYPEPYPDVAEVTARTTDALAVAETTTDHLVAPALAVLDEPDRDRFVDLVGATRRALI
jgi:hypothetical protein